MTPINTTIKHQASAPSRVRTVAVRFWIALPEATCMELAYRFWCRVPKLMAIRPATQVIPNAP